VRSAFTDVTLHAHIDDRTVANIREAYQISLLVFSKRVSDKLTKLAGIAFRLGHKPLERKTEKDLDDEHMLGDELQKVVEEMQSEAALNKWL
jgi:hypothetical protein